MAGPRYTSYDRLARKLRGRLKLGADYPSESEISNPLSSLLAYQPAASDQTVDTLLIDDIAEQEESMIDLVVGQLYVLPFRFTSDVTVNIIGSISESFILSSLISVHFTGNPGVIATDISTAAIDWRRFGEFRLHMLTAGENVWFPSSLAIPQQNVNVPQTQSLVLPGEVRLGQSDRPDLISRNYSFTGRRNQNSNAFFNDRCNGCQPRPDNTALGSTPKRYDICNNDYPDYEVFQ